MLTVLYSFGNTNLVLLSFLAGQISVSHRGRNRNIASKTRHRRQVFRQVARLEAMFRFTLTHRHAFSYPYSFGRERTGSDAEPIFTNDLPVDDPTPTNYGDDDDELFTGG